MNTLSEPTGNYVLQLGLSDIHRKNLDWLSAILLWKRETIFFQKLLDQNAPQCSSMDDKKRIDHFQNLIYHSGEAIDQLGQKVNESENSLAKMIQERNESDALFLGEHQVLSDELNSFYSNYAELKKELFDFIEGVI